MIAFDAAYATATPSSVASLIPRMVCLSAADLPRLSFLSVMMFTDAEVTVKQLKEKVKELDEKLESTAQVHSNFFSHL